MNEIKLVWSVNNYRLNYRVAAEWRYENRGWLLFQLKAICCFQHIMNHFGTYLNTNMFDTEKLKLR